MSSGESGAPRWRSAQLCTDVTTPATSADALLVPENVGVYVRRGSSAPGNSHCPYAAVITLQSPHACTFTRLP